MWFEAVSVAEITKETSERKRGTHSPSPGSPRCLEFGEMTGARRKGQRRSNQGGRKEDRV